MSLAILLLIWVLNLGISIWNGVQTGRAWVESKHAGGWRRFMAWMGAIMTAIGFTWCYLVVEGIIAYQAHWLDADHTALLFNAGYVLIVPPLLFAGYAITINSWAEAYRRKTIGGYGVAAYNSFASVYNTYNAVNSYGEAFGSVAESFTKRLGKDKNSGQLLLVLVLLIIAFGLGIMTAYWLIHKFAAADEPLPEKQSDVPAYRC